jgi:hypothetical protein
VHLTVTPLHPYNLSAIAAQPSLDNPPQPSDTVPTPVPVQILQDWPSSAVFLLVRLHLMLSLPTREMIKLLVVLFYDPKPSFAVRHRLFCFLSLVTPKPLFWDAFVQTCLLWLSSQH